MREGESECQEGSQAHSGNMTDEQQRLSKWVRERKGEIAELIRQTARARDREAREQSGRERGDQQRVSGRGAAAAAVAAAAATAQLGLRRCS